MASGRASDPGALPEERDRPRQGLVRLRRVRLLVHVGQPRHARHVLQPGRVRLRARPHRRSLSILLSAVAVTFLAIAYAGLIAVMPRAGGDYVWQSRVLDGLPGDRRRRGRRRRRRLPRRAGRSARTARSRSAAASSVVVVGGLDRPPPRRRSASSWRPPAGGSSSRCGRRSTARSSRSSSSSRSRRSLGSADGVDVLRRPTDGTLVVSLVVDRPDVRPRRARDGRLRPDPAPGACTSA